MILIPSMIFDLDAPYQYKSIDAGAQKNRSHSMPSICFAYWKLIV